MNYARAMRIDPAGTLHVISGEPAIPIERKGRVVWLTRRQFALARYLFDGRTFTLRGAAADLGYSFSGLRDALAQLARLWVIEWRSLRGRAGGSWGRLIRGWRRSKAPPGRNDRTVDSVRDISLSMREDNSSKRTDRSLERIGLGMLPPMLGEMLARGPR